ncbi:hypothetical protein Moror_13659 [Moniliophthora roreri MCA 2997]|uniref:F-box domain-containing protein n=2 Tax=Moniliophthora roreri TaxID=221103 RepID=V2YFG2_MONRO|nr:hypothetical protein Moror_13659 [Moniliophthora roreri MCA 2997]
MASQGLLTLPTELLQEIGEYLGYDTNNLWAANKRLYDALSPNVFRCITINIKRTCLSSGLSLISLLSTRNVHWAGYVKKLKIKAICPYYPVISKRYAVYGSLPDRFANDEEQGWLDIAEELMNEHLGPAISSLENVTVVEWYPTHEDLVFTRKIIIHSLVCLPITDLLLESEKMSPFACRLPPFRHLNGLRRLTIRGYLGNTLDQISEAIANSSELEDLTIDIRSFPARPGVPPPVRHKLDEAFSKIPSALQLRLSHITLGGLAMDLNLAHARNHLRKLTSLTILDIHVQTSGLWTVLQQCGVKLRHLSCHAVEDALILYLKSYVGLEELSLSLVHAQPFRSSLEIELQFYTEVIPHHATTLKHVYIVAAFLKSWALRVQYIPSFLGCLELRSLTVSAHSIWREQGNNPIRSLLLGILSLPKLESLRFVVQVNESGSSPSLPEQREERRNIVRIQKAIQGTALRTSRAKHSCPRLKPGIHVAEYTYFYRLHEGDNNTVVYRPVLSRPQLTC